MYSWRSSGFIRRALFFVGAALVSLGLFFVEGGSTGFPSTIGCVQILRGASLPTVGPATYKELFEPPHSYLPAPSPLAHWYVVSSSGALSPIRSHAASAFVGSMLLVSRAPLSVSSFAFERGGCRL